uniref:CSON000337 protein n=1 Tax=Culicoides sonorensis TaxID=179676 RepID=A0A336LQ29_CULSO
MSTASNAADSSKSDILESWEEIDEVQLDSTVNRLKEETMKSRIEEERLASGPPSTAVQILQKPVVILKRPTNNQNGSENGVTSNGNARPKTQIKSLHQRQQEYAEARMRILGSMPDDDDKSMMNDNATTTRASDGNGLIMRR